MLLILLFSVSLVLFFVRPHEISMPFNYLCFADFLISGYLYFSYKKKKNYFDFDTIFVLLYAVIGFAYSVFFYDENNPYSIAYNLSFDVNYIPIGSILFVIGIQAYFIGSISIRERALQKNPLLESELKPVNNTLLSIVVIFLSIAFVLAGGVSFYRAIYYLKSTEQPQGMVFQIMSLLHSFAVAAIATEFYNKAIDRSYKLNKVLIIAILCIIILMLYAGNRTLASQLALPILGLFTLFFLDIGKVKILIFVLVGIVFMWVIQLKRSGVAIESAPKVEELILDITINTRTTYSCMEYVDTFGYTYGMNMVGGLIGTVPSLERLLNMTIGLDSRKIGSAEVLTDFTLGPSPFVGLGTNIIADIYLSFGLVGVIVLMFVLGYFVNMQLYRARQLHYYSVIIYACIMSYSVFLVRTTYTHPCRLIIWCLIIGILNRSLTQKLFDRPACKK